MDAKEVTNTTLWVLKQMGKAAAEEFAATLKGKLRTQASEAISNYRGELGEAASNGIDRAESFAAGTSRPTDESGYPTGRPTTQDEYVSPTVQAAIDQEAFNDRAVAQAEKEAGTFASNMAPENQKVVKEAGTVNPTAAPERKDLADGNVDFLSEFTGAQGTPYTEEQVSAMTDQEKKISLERLGKKNIAPENIDTEYRKLWKSASQLFIANEG